MQDDGKVVLVGGAGSALGLVRYNPDGTLDTQFGRGGKVTTAFGSSLTTAYAVAIQPDGKIVVAGRTRESTASDQDIMVARYGPNGALDSAFGVAGLATVDLVGGPTVNNGMAVQNDGRIVVAGRYRSSATAALVVRLNEHGSLDTGFGDKLLRWYLGTGTGC